MEECHLQTVYRAGTVKPPVCEVIDNDEVWLIKNPALYYPLDNQDAKQMGSPSVCLWKAEIKHHPKGLVIKDHSMFKGVCVVKGKQKMLKKFMESLCWEKSSVPQCRGGLSMMDFDVINQAVLYYMIENPPTTPEDFNFHAELKAASHWHWPQEDETPNFASGPHDDLRLKKAAAIALKGWSEELCKAREQAGMNDHEEYISDLEEIIFNLSMYYKGTLEETDDDNPPSIDTLTSHEDDRSPEIRKHVSPRRSPRKRKQAERGDSSSPAKRPLQRPKRQLIPAH